MKRKYTVLIQVVDHDGGSVRQISIVGPKTVGEMEARLRRRGWIGTLQDGETILDENVELPAGSNYKMFLVDPGKLQQQVQTYMINLL